MGTDNKRSRSRFSEIVDDEYSDEEVGEEIESAPPLKVREERELNSIELKKKLLKRGVGYDTPELGDEVTVHIVGSLLDGTKFESTRDRGEPMTLKLGNGELAAGVDQGIITMEKGECALFTLPPQLAYGSSGHEGVAPNVAVRFEVELISWITVVDICKDGGIVKKVLEKGARNEQPGDLDEVLVKYQVILADGSVVAKTPEAGVEFHIKDGHLCPALPKALVTMSRGDKVKLIVKPQYASLEKENFLGDGFQNVPPGSVLTIDLELVSFKPVIDITGDSKVYKKLLKEGEGASVANDGASVTIKFVARLEDGTVYEKKGYDGEEPLNFVTDEEQAIVGLDRAVSTMKKGEKAIVTIDHIYGFGTKETKQDLAVVPPCSNLYYEVEMVDFVKEKAPWELNNHERIEAARRKKEEGNVLYRGGKFQQAGKKYDKAADYVYEDGDFVVDGQKQVKELRASCWLNGAACSLKLKDFQEATRLCSKVLDIEFHNTKALYRRAQAYMATGDLISSEIDIKKAIDIDPHNRELKSLQRKLKELQDESNRRDAKLYANMFAQSTKDSTPVTKRMRVDKLEDHGGREGLAMDVEKTADSAAPSDNAMAIDSLT